MISKGRNGEEGAGGFRRERSTVSSGCGRLGRARDLQTSGRSSPVGWRAGGGGRMGVRMSTGLTATPVTLFLIRVKST